MTRPIPRALIGALAPITIVSGHYGAGKTNFSINLALDMAESGKDVALVDLDIVNPYFRASEQRRVLEAASIELVAPVFSEAGTSLDVPSLTGRIMPVLEDASKDLLVIVDLGGDDVGAAALGRFSKLIAARSYALLYILNRHRNLMADPADAVENLREIESATHLQATALVDNAHMKYETDAASLADPQGYAAAVCELTNLPLVAKTAPFSLRESAGEAELVYSVGLYIKNPWE